MRNEFSGTGFGPVIQAGHIDRVEVYNRPPVTHLRQLPPAARLIGRNSELAELRSRLESAPAAAIVVHGRPWVGKSALALAFAHEIAEGYPDGQIYLDCGENEQPVASQIESLRWVLRSMGVAPEYIPAKLGQLVSAYRSVLADRRVLILLDNVVQDSAVELFATGTALVLATCRGTSRLSNDAARLCLSPLAVEDSAALLRRAAGADMYWQTDDADRLAALCGCLPRPLVAVGNHLRNTTSSAGWFVDALSDGRTGLSALTANGTTLRDSLAASYRRLPDAVRSVFRRLGCFPGETITSSAVEAVADEDVDAHGAIDAMVAEGLLVEQWLGGGCADFPAPFRMMAQDLLADEDRSAPARVLDQALTFYADKAESALAVWLGDHPSDIDPDMSEMVRRTSRGFLMGESDNLLRLLDNAATHNLDAAVRMAVPLLEYLTRNDPKADLEAVHESVRYAITELPEDHRDTFDLFLTMNAVYKRLSRPAEAADCLLTAQKAAEDAGDGQLAEQAARLLLVAFEDKLTAARGAEDRDGIANGLMLVASAHRDLGDPTLARQLLLEALTHTHATGNVPYAAEILADLGDVSRTIGQLAESAQFLQESVRLFEQAEDREGLALALESLSDTFTELGMHPEAAAALERSDSLLLDDD